MNNWITITQKSFFSIKSINISGLSEPIALEADSEVTTGSQAIDFDAVNSAAGQVITRIKANKEVFPDSVFGTASKHDPWLQYRDRRRWWADNMNGQTGRDNPGSEAATLHEFYFRRGSYSKLADMYATIIGKIIAGYGGTVFLVLEHQFRHDAGLGHQTPDIFGQAPVKARADIPRIFICYPPPVPTPLLCMDTPLRL